MSLVYNENTTLGIEEEYTFTFTSNKTGFYPNVTLYINGEEVNYTNIVGDYQTPVDFPTNINDEVSGILEVFNANYCSLNGGIS